MNSPSGNIPEHLHEKYWQIATRRKSSHPAVVYPHKRGQPYDVAALFDGPVNRYCAELGLGFGEVAIERAKNDPQTGCIGFEIKWDRISKILKEIDRHGLTNLKIAPLNMNWFYSWMFQPESLDEIMAWFPDPWPKKRHWKHRLVNDAFLRQTHTCLKPGGTFRFSSDYSPYARRSIALLRRQQASEKLWVSQKGGFMRSDRPVIGSYFEERQMASGYRPWYICFQKPDTSANIATVDTNTAYV